MMPITHDPGFPPEISQLVAAFNAVADGHSPDHVMEAAANFFIAAMNFYAIEKGYSAEEAEQFAARVCDSVIASRRRNFKRTPQPGDIQVRQQ